MLCVTFCLVENIWQSQDVSNLTPPGPSKAILPNDMISVKELHTALGGMDTVLLCLQNKMKVEPKWTMPDTACVLTGIFPSNGTNISHSNSKQYFRG